MANNADTRVVKPVTPFGNGMADVLASATKGANAAKANLADAKNYQNGVIADNATLATQLGGTSNAKGIITQSIPAVPAVPVVTQDPSGTGAIDAILGSSIGFSAAEIANFYNEYKTGVPTSKIVDEIRATPTYSNRFPGMAALVKTGNRISEGEYIAKETQDRVLMNQYLGASASNYNSTAQLGQLIGGNVDSVQLEKRLQMANDAVLKADPATVQWFKDNGFTNQDLAAYWLNPSVAQPDLERRLAMGQIGGAADKSGFGNISSDQANALAAQGVTPGQALSGFGKIGMDGQLTQQLPGETNPPVTQNDLINATFSNNAQAQQKINLLTQQRVGQFQQNGGPAMDATGVSGLRSAAVQ